MTQKTWMKPADEPLHPAALECLAIYVKTRLQEQTLERDAMLQQLAGEFDLREAADKR